LEVPFRFFLNLDQPFKVYTFIYSFWKIYEVGWSDMKAARGFGVSLWSLSFCLPFVGILFMGKGVKTGTRDVKYSSINGGRFM